MQYFFDLLVLCDDFMWGYLNFVIILICGLYISYKSNFLQFGILANFKKVFADIKLQNKESKNNEGLNAFKLYFASVGGTVGLGNVVGISTAVIIGGPGSIFWMWVASILGMMVKYSEIFLGIKYRKSHPTSSGVNKISGGMMYYLQEAFPGKSVAVVASVLLCIYGVEVYQFVVLTDTIHENLNINRNLVIFGLLCLTFFSVMGGIKRLANICTILMPPFMIIYIIVSIYVIGLHYKFLPTALLLIFNSAFFGQAAIGGFVGSGVIIAAHQGISRAIYSGDIGIGYDSIVQSQTRIKDPKIQAKLAVFGLLADTLICTLTSLLVVVSGAWYMFNHLQPSSLISAILSLHIPHVQYFMTATMFLAGFTTIIAFLSAGLKCAEFLSVKWGEKLYLAYAFFAFIFFCGYDQTQVILIMSVASSLLVLINITAIIKLRNKIDF